MCRNPQNLHCLNHKKQMYPFTLKYFPGNPALVLRPLSGREELAVLDTGIITALNVLDSLIDHHALKADQITTADRDRILAFLYTLHFGPNIESKINCRFCQKPVDLNFSLDDLRSHIEQQHGSPVAGQLEDGSFELPSGCRFRLPTGSDELALVGFPPASAASMLLRRCIIAGDPGEYGEAAQRAMEEIAPLLQTEMTANCPECGQEQQLRFDIQSFLLNRLKNERQRTAWEVHLLASAYRWSHREIVELPRALRRMYVAFLES